MEGLFGFHRSASRDIAIIPLHDPRYPPLLRRVYDPPAALYVRGDINVISRTDAIAVVGTRQMTRYGETVATRIASSVAATGTPIISGLALGIDAVAHEATLAAGGIAVAVLAAGVADRDIGPRANFGLAQRILKNGGVLLSEFPSGTPATKEKFPLRNRIVAGLSKATIVIEAAKKSGALITARLALEDGRDVYAVPGPITSSASEGTNLLISQGATPILSTDALLEELGLTPASSPTMLSDDERTVLEQIKKGITSPDAIAQITGLPTRKVAAALAALTIK